MIGPTPPPRGSTPRVLVASACEVFGTEEVRDWCAGLAVGAVAVDAADRPHIGWLGGTTGWPEHWARAWGARGLLHLGPPVDEAVLRAMLGDPQWRVRESALKVVARWRLDPGEAVLLGLTDDPVERVRVQAWRALGRPAAGSRGRGHERAHD